MHLQRIEPMTIKKKEKDRHYLMSIDELRYVTHTPEKLNLVKVKKPTVIEAAKPKAPVVTITKAPIPKPGPKDNDILFCIFNYRQDDNARRWYKILSPYFKTVVLDSGNDKKCDDFTQFPNIYYSGLFNEAKKLQNKGHYKWVGIITSDVKIDDANAKLFIDKINWLKTTQNIGVYSILGSKDGHSNGYQYASTNLGTFRYAEGFFQVINGAVLDAQPFVDLLINKYGYGIDYLTCFIATMCGKIIYIDEDVNIFHPSDKGYDRQDAIKYQKLFYRDIKEHFYKYFTVSVSSATKRNESIDGLSKVKYIGGNEDYFGLSIILTAFNVQDYIQETLKSIYNQDFIKNNRNYEVLIGIDGCEKTLKSVKEVMSQYPNIRVLMMDSNKGTFVTSNTLIKEAKFSKILRFDTDDLMINDMLNKIMEASKTYDIVRFWYNDYYDKNKITPINACAYGSVLYDKRVFKECGGYKNWKCSGDYELFSRVKYHFRTKEIREHLYQHRIRTDSLMHKSDTSMDSEYRKALNASVRIYRRNENIYIQPIYNTFKEIFSSYMDINGFSEELAKHFTSQTLRYVCDVSNRDELIPEYSDSERYIISMTSWTKRINNVRPVIESLLAGNVKPDKIVINLAEEEFPNKELDLPQDLVQFVSDNPTIEIRWLVHNTKVWKKILPTLMKYPNDCIIGIDDDFKYPANFLEVLKAEHLKKPDVGISGNKETLVGVKAHCGCGTLVKYSMFGEHLNDLNKEMLGSHADDLFYTYAMAKNKHKYEFAGTLFFTNMPKFNEVEGYSRSNHINVYTLWKALYQPLLK